MYHMKQASVRDLRYEFKKIERLLRQGQEVQITKRRRVIARLVPETTEAVKPLPDFLARLRTIYGGKVLTVSGSELLASDRSRY
jgi:antitoxin (DNA-binding transcriptional repressor) of toxin-antitoxin stability system